MKELATNKVVKTPLYPIASVLLLFALLLPSAAVAQTPGKPEKRVLFVVETSSDMRKLSDATSQSLSALIESGLGGVLADGDSVGLWTFNAELHAGGLPPQRWTAASAPETAKQITEFLKTVKFEKPPNLEKVMLPLSALIRSSRSLVVVLLTSGTKSIQGTPFDADINASFKQHRREYQKQGMPFATIFLVQNGQLIRHSVNPAIGDVKIPKFPPQPPQKPVVAAKPAVRPAPKEPPPAPPVVRSNQALVITKDGAKVVNTTNAEVPEIAITTPSGTKTNLPLFGQVTATETQTFTVPSKTEQRETNISSASEAPLPAQQLQQPAPPTSNDVKVEISKSQPPSVAVTAPAVTNTAAPGQTKPAVVANNSPEAIVAKPQASVVAAATTAAQPTNADPVVAVARSTPAPIPAAPQASPAKVEPSPAPQEPGPTAIAPTPAPQIGVVQQRATTSKSQPYLVIAIVLVVIAIIVAFLLGRYSGKRTSGPSFITQGVDRSNKK